jgi:hypothetical protein
MVKMTLQKLTRKHTPACPTSRIHVLIDLVVDFVRFLVILLVRGACEETVFVVWILKLIRIDFLFPSFRLGFSVERS